MSTTESPGQPPISPDEDQSRVEGIEERLARIETKVDRGNREGRRAGQSFAIFAVLALMLAFGTMIAVVAKLDKSTPAASTAAATPAVTATATPQPVPASRVAVALREYTVKPSSSVGQAGKVTFAVQNAGTVTHEFVVIKTDKPASGLLKGDRADETGNVGETGDLQPGQAKTIRLNLTPGHYALICNLPGHYSAGQHTDFTVR